MKIREFRVRYSLKTSLGYDVVHGVICDLYHVKDYVDKVKEVGYKLIGIDERYREDDERTPLDYGWNVIRSYVPEEPKPKHGYLSFAWGRGGK